MAAPPYKHDGVSKATIPRTPFRVDVGLNSGAWRLRCCAGWDNDSGGGTPSYDLFIARDIVPLR
ncbi:hypothetical protein [Citrobacter freundii]|uniref:hypothetical protein n=1 Tax=Citrobacter freundii TaxID=546 RepID=UPI001FFE27A2|nr:hypothetical protein [Citrobacter freundii]